MIKILSFSRYLRKLYLLKSELERLMLASVAFSTFMVGVRIVYTHTITFIFLEWNLFLAFIPYFITQWLMGKPSVIENKWKFGLVFFAWLMFIPNALYILTDLFHLPENKDTPQWFDLLLIFSFAWNGLMAGILSIRHMEKMVQSRWGYQHEMIFVAPVMILNSLGIFIGRYLRYNSWDVITNPFRLMMDIVDMMAHPIIYKEAWGMIMFYSVFITLVYMMMKRISSMVSW